MFPFRKVIDVVLLLIPAILGFVGQATLLPGWLVLNVDFLKGTDPNILKDWSFGIGTVISGLLVALQIVSLKSQHEVDQQAIDRTLALWRDILTDLLRKAVRNQSLVIHIRVLRPKKWYEKRSWAEWINKKTEYKVVHIPGLADDTEPDNMCFQMWPNPQGIAGKAYEVKEECHDFDITARSMDAYNMTPFQKQLLAKTKSVLCIPIVDEDNRIRYIASIDSRSRLKNRDPRREQKIVEIVISSLALIGGMIPVIARKR